jgi:prepilin signal peptidase PulO-like enzyme (type II secretory pathway)
MILPDQFTLLLLLPALVSAIYDIFCGGNVFFRKDVILPFFGTVTGIIMPILGAVCGGLVMLLLNLIGKLIYKKEAVGFGDVKLFAVLGLFVGPMQIIFVFFITVLIAGLHFIYLILRKKLDGNHYLPLGPYICTAFLLLFVFYSQINYLQIWFIFRVPLLILVQSDHPSSL